MKLLFLKYARKAARAIGNSKLRCSYTTAMWERIALADIKARGSQGRIHARPHVLAR